eukprot:jgi/Tetstr1/426040/TSEL_016384.t1
MRSVRPASNTSPGGWGGGMATNGAAAVTGARFVGHWALGARIGSGSFAVVWKAVHRSSGAVAAVKEIWTEKLNAKLRESLASEMSILTRTEHPNIVRLLEIIKEKEQGRIYLVLEFCAGGDLSGLIRRVKTLPEATVRGLMQQLAAGLKELRALNLIHRDLKPQNLLLSGAGPDAVLKIADFGFARDLQPQGLAETLCGSPLYMAPEILQFRKYDAKADLWSVGAILFEMVAGQPPFNGRNHVELLRNIERGEARLPVAAAARVSPACKQLLGLLLKRNPVERIGFEEDQPQPQAAAAPPVSPARGATVVGTPSPQVRPPAVPVSIPISQPPADALSPAVAATAPGASVGSSGSSRRFTSPSLPRLPAALWDALAGGNARRANAADQQSQQFGPPLEGLKVTERPAGSASLSESFERDFVVISTHSSPSSSSHSDGAHANAAIANLSMPLPAREVPPPAREPLPQVNQHVKPPATPEAAAPTPGGKASPRDGGAPATPAATPPAGPVPAPDAAAAPRAPFLQSVAEHILALAGGRIADGAPAEALVLSWLAMRTLVEASRSEGAPGSTGLPRVAASREQAAAGVRAALQSAAAQATAAAEALPPDGAAEPLPCPLELAYRLALDYGRAGTVDELMGNFGRSASSYLAATQLLMFLLEEVPRLAAGPALPAAEVPLPPADERRLRRYVRSLSQRGAACSLRCAPPAGGLAGPAVPLPRAQPARPPIPPARQGKPPQFAPKPGLHMFHG